MQKCTKSSSKFLKKWQCMQLNMGCSEKNNCFMKVVVEEMYIKVKHVK